MSSVFRIPDTGLGAITASATVPVGQTYRVMHVTCHFGGAAPTAPTTSENFTVTLDAIDGPAFDPLLYSVDPSAGATTDILWYPDEELFVIGGDQIDVAFAGSDNIEFGVLITLKRVL